MHPPPVGPPKTIVSFVGTLRSCLHRLHGCTPSRRPAKAGNAAKIRARFAMQMQWRLATRSTSNGAGARTNVQFNSSRMTLQSEGPRRTRCRMRCWASHVARRALPRDVQQLPRRVGGSTDGHTPCLSRHAWNSRLHAAAACASTQATHARRSRGAGRMPSLRGPCRAFLIVPRHVMGSVGTDRLSRPQTPS